MADPNTRQGKRTPVTLKIKFKSETLEQFIERYAVDVSQGGIFIRTKEPLAVGTQMRFEFQLRDASPLIAGEGTVVWTRENDPSRPAIAPGMGVRFDRLAEGSQTVLERILAEKAKQAPQRTGVDSTKPPMFTDTPTRVAPAPVQEALLGKSEDSGVGGPGGPRRKRPDSFGDQGTPLPNPMPFHSDADEFPEEAFEEATKVRALDELIAQTADATKTAVTAPAAAAADELAARRGVRADSTIADPPAPADKVEAKAEGKPAPVADRDSAPGLPSPPEHAAKHAEPKITPPAKTQLGLEPAKPARPGTPSTPPTTSPAPARPVAKDATTKPTGMRAVAAEPKVPDAPAKSGPPVVLLLLLLLAIGGAAVWFFVIRPKGDDVDTTTGKKPGSNATPGSGSANVVTSPGSGSAGSAEVGPGSGSAMVQNGSNTGSGSATTNTGSGSAVAMTGSNTGSGGTNPGSGSAMPPAAELVETTISAPGADKVSVEVLGTDQTGAAPLKAKLEKGKAYRARIQAPGYMIVEIDVKGGEKASGKLVAKPRMIDVTSDPPGARIVIDNADTGKTTPSQVELTKAQAGKKSVRVAIRKAGMKPIERVIDGGKYTEDADKMIAKLEEKLEKAPVVVQQPNNNGGGNTTNTGKGSGAGSATPTNGGGSGSDTSGGGTGSSGTTGSGTGSASTGTGGTGAGAGTGGTGTGSSGTGTGSAKPPTGTGTGSATKPPTGTGTGSATKPPPTGTGSGSSEPEPDFLK